MEVKTDTQDFNELMLRRREELEQLKNNEINPYPYGFERNGFSKEIIDSFKDDAPQRIVAVAGRIMSIRKMGKAAFCHIQDSQGKIQIYLRKDDLGEFYDSFKLLDIGDIIGVEGYVFRTKMGEVSVHAQKVVLLAKSLRPLPIAKETKDEQGNTVVHDPFSDKELRYRQRYVDLVVNSQVKDVFVKRAKIISTMRRFFEERGYLEVETPILQPQYGGAFARPFTTHHNTLDVEMFLRVANELYLKRLIVGGFDGVFEFAKDFRNEGMDRTHNPEFTMLEIYVAYKDYIWMMEMVEQLISQVAMAVNGSMKAKLGENEIDFTAPWTRLTMFDAIEKYTGKQLREKNEDELRAIAKEINIEIPAGAGSGAIIDEIFSEKVEHHLIQPTFITDYPVEMSPLAKKHRSEAGLVERFEAICNGQELCNAFSELNDPLDQRARFEEQMRMKAKGQAEVQPLDEDFLRALEYGMPPTAGLGIGIDRLTMLLTGQDSIRDVIFFPQMKPEKALNDPVREDTDVDQFTSALNKKHFNKRLEEEVQRAKDFGAELSLVSIAIDGMQEHVNRYGKEGFEGIVEQVSKLVRANTQPYDVLGLVNANTLNVLLVNTTTNDAYIWADRVRGHIASNTLLFGRLKCSVTVSVGVCGLNEGMRQEDLIAGTSQMLNKAIESGGNLVRKVP